MKLIKIIAAVELALSLFMGFLVLSGGFALSFFHFLILISFGLSLSVLFLRRRKLSILFISLSGGLMVVIFLIFYVVIRLIEGFF